MQIDRSDWFDRLASFFSRLLLSGWVNLKVDLNLQLLPNLHFMFLFANFRYDVGFVARHFSFAAVSGQFLAMWPLGHTQSI